MRYAFTTLAVGKEYLDNAIDCYIQMNKYLNCDFSITTNEKIDSSGKVSFNYFSLDRYNDDKPGFSFYLNLKVLSLKCLLDRGYDFVVYNDADWKPTDNLSEEKLRSLFQFMDDRGIDMLFERPARIGYYKENINECFFSEKLYDYNVFDHEKWDNAHVVNEQFLVFKVNWKFKYFVNRWEQFLWYSIANNIRSYPDGFEIGVSAYESDMNVDYDSWRSILSNCFKYKDRQGKENIRF